MRVTFVSNYINHHQIPLAEVLYQQWGDGYRFIQTEPMEEERVQQGWEVDLSAIPYLMYYKNAPEECVLNYPDIGNGWDMSAWYSVFGLDFRTDRFNKSSTAKSFLSEALTRHGYARRWSASDALNGMCPSHPDKVLAMIASHWNASKATDGGNALDTRVTVAVRSSGDCGQDGKFQTGPVKFFYAWSRVSISGDDINSVSSDEKNAGVKAAIDNLFKVKEFRMAMMCKGDVK